MFPASDYGLFLSDEDPRKGIWLESGRTLDYYMLRNGVGMGGDDPGQRTITSTSFITGLTSTGII
jgi:hypothetical protein